MTSSPKQAAAGELVEKNGARPASISWANVPETPSSEGRRRRQSSLASSTGSGSVGSVGSLGGVLPSASGGSRATRQRSLSSPPPPPTFLKRVSFDTFDNKDASDFSLTLKSKHKDYAYTRRSRTFLCGTDQNDYSEFALEWLIDELVDDGDEIVCLRVVDKDSKISSDSALQEKQYRQEAKKLLNQIIEKNDEDKTISIILEFAVGKVHETIQKMIHIYEPVILIVGTRGRSLGGLQGLLPGSVSKYCLQHSPVPVIVVRPSSKREKKKEKRKADPGRKVYQEILQSSGEFMTHNNYSHGGVSAISGITEGMSNTSISSLGEISPGTQIDPEVSPKTSIFATSDSPSPQSLTPNPETTPIGTPTEEKQEGSK
ncbi:uncharacterized protein LAJ45_01963 [Morchella importuna]|uniref:Adenine nucleotide alpha hydrolases-like protein n=1 Tax=Morchella conica CCBAS932 TaxID=1392247 RepID=A0A3N4L8G3_9PEZI|nr:uncharacterized protein LAJ45_01963 [Morchella importuna]KAH8154195.1 hypothetical protein LAJ45_01963 [Morchella importuna]RPB16921.1 adenine nucleotide alpha hydrolases-like protein [Morchella conica CCBAS932]